MYVIEKSILTQDTSKDCVELAKLHTFFMI